MGEKRGGGKYPPVYAPAEDMVRLFYTLYKVQIPLLHCSKRCLAHDVVHLYYFVLVTVHNTTDALNVPLSPFEPN